MEGVEDRGSVAGSATPSDVPFPWEGAADELCNAMVRRSGPHVQRLAERLYEELLNDTQDFLRDNARFNLSGELQRAQAKTADMQAQLERVAEALGLGRDWFTFHSPQRVGDQIIAAIEKLKGESALYGSRDIDAHRQWLTERADWLRREYQRGGNYEYLKTKEDECRHALARLVPQPSTQDSAEANHG